VNVRGLIAKALRLPGRLLLWSLLLLVLLMLPVMGMLGSEAGSRWLLEQGLGMQRMLTLEVKGGTLLEGMELAEVRLHTRKSDLYIRHVLARWSLLQLFRGELDLLQVQADGVILTLTAPPSQDPVRLPRLILPVALDIHHLELTNVRLRKQGSEWSVARMAAKGYWHGATVIVDSLQAQEPRYGELTLTGKIRLLSNYPLQASGQLSPRWLSEKGWKALQISLSGTVASLDVTATSRERYPASLVGNVRPLLPAIPYSASLNWSDLNLPWLTAYEIRSDKGRLKVIGDKSGLRSQGEMALQTKYTPPANYHWQVDTDWRKAQFESLKINTLGGEIKAKGEIGWPSSGLDWAVSSSINRIDLAKHWAVPRSILPVLNGSFTSKGHSGVRGSTVAASLKLADGEQWVLKDNASGILWSPQSVHDASATWTHVSRPMSGVKFIQSDRGQLTVKGNAAAYTAGFDAGLTTGLMPAGLWHGQIAGGGRHLEIQTLSYEGEAGAFQAEGELDFQQDLVWRGGVVLSDFDSTWVLPDWSGQFSGAVSGQGVWGKRHREVDLSDVAIAGVLRDQPLQLNGPIRVRWLEKAWPRVATEAFKASWAGNSVVLEGGLQEQWKATVNADLANPGLLYPGVQGHLQGRAVISGAEHAPDVDLDLSVTQGGYNGHTVQSANVQASIPALGNAQGAAYLVLNGLTTKNDLAVGDMSLMATGTVAEHQVEWQLQGEPVAMTGALNGGLNPSTGDWQGALQQGQIVLGELKWSLAEAVPVSWLAASRELQLGSHCWHSAPAALCASEPLMIGPAGKVALSLSDFHLERLSAFMPEGLAWLGAVTGAAKAEWQPNQAPTATAQLRTESGEVRLSRDDGNPLSLRYDQLGVDLEANPSTVNASLTLTSSDLGKGRLDATINPFTEGRPITGEVALEGLRLELLQPFLPALSQLTGKVSAEGRLDGSLLHPRYWGSVKLTEGKLAVRNAPLAVDDLSAWAEVQGDRAELSGRLASGEGEGEAILNGQASWSDQISLALNLKGSRFAVKQEPEIAAELSPDLHINVVPGQLSLTGSIGVPYARINIKKLPERSVALSSDVKVVESADGRVRASATKRGQSMTINADVELALGEDVFFNGFGVMGALNGSVHLRQSAQRGLEAYGELGLDKEARYEAYGQKLKVRSGRLVFAGNMMQPAINAEAVREVDDKVVGIRVEGRANAPEATLFSEPTMPQGDMLSYLVLGRPLAQRSVDGSNAGNDAMLAAAAIKLGAKGGEGLTSGIGNVIGVRDLSLDAEGSGDDTQVKVSGYLSPDLFLSYGVGVFTPVNTVTMRYQVRPRLYLEAVSSLENAIDLFYNFRF
jgi:translocation and assembly module TamB